MKRTAAFLAGLALAGGTAFAALQETSTQSEYETQTETQDPTEPETSTLPESEQTYETETETQMGHDVTQMSSDELSGKTVMTTEGEEIGTVEQVGYSSTHQETVATVNVGGFLGVGEKLIAIPLSDLQMGSDDSLQTTMSRQEIESAQEFDASSLSTEEPYEQQ